MDHLPYLRFLHLVSFLFVTAQVLFYLIVYANAMRAVPLGNFLEQRRAVDGIIGGRYRILYYACLALSITMAAATAKQPASIVFITSSFALFCLVIDLAITVKGNLPLNALMNAGTPLADGAAVRAQWLRYITWRGVASSVGMLVLIGGLVFENASAKP